MPERIPPSTAIRVPLQAYLASDHVTPATGKTIVITISKNGGAYGNPSAGATNATEIANGSYYVDLSTTDTGTAGPLFIRGTSATIDDVIAIYDVAAMAMPSVDGVSYDDMMTAIMATLFGVAVPTGSITAFKKRDGTTTKVSNTYGSVDGERTASSLL